MFPDIIEPELAPHYLRLEFGFDPKTPGLHGAMNLLLYSINENI